MLPSHSQLKWLNSAIQKREPYFVENSLIGLKSIHWLDVRFLTSLGDALAAQNKPTRLFLLFKYIKCSLMHQQTSGKNWVVLELILDNLSKILSLNPKNIQIIVDWITLNLIQSNSDFLHNSIYTQCQSTSSASRLDCYVYLLLQTYLSPNTKNMLAPLEEHIDIPYINALNQNSNQQQLNAITQAQIDWVQQALKQETRFDPGVEIGQRLSSIPWDSIEFLDACKDVFYSCQFETARFITFKYIQLSLTHQRQNPAASAGMMQFLYKNLGAILRQPMHDLEILLHWLNTMYIPPRTPEQLEPYYEYHCARAQYEQALQLNPKGKVTVPEYPSAQIEWTAERTMYKTVNDYIKALKNYQI